jgi:hypothetical protein
MMLRRHVLTLRYWLLLRTQCLVPWACNYGNQMFRASDNVAREDAQEIITVLFKYRNLLFALLPF